MHRPKNGRHHRGQQRLSGQRRCAPSDRGDRSGARCATSRGAIAAQEGRTGRLCASASPSPRWRHPTSLRWPRGFGRISPFFFSWPHRHPDQQRRHPCISECRGLQRRAGRRNRMDTNYFGAIRAMQGVAVDCALPGVALIINTSPSQGVSRCRSSARYCATKHALEAYARACATKFPPSGIDIALVEPGPFRRLPPPESRPPAAVCGLHGDLGQVPAAMIAGFTQMAEPAIRRPTRNGRRRLSRAELDAAPGRAPPARSWAFTWGVGRDKRFHPAAAGRPFERDAARHRARRRPRLTTSISPPEKGPNSMKKTLMQLQPRLCLATGALAR